NVFQPSTDDRKFPDFRDDLKASLHPPFFTDDGWDAVFASLMDGVDTFGAYQRLLADAATHLNRVGARTDDPVRALDLLLQNANNDVPGRTLAPSTDASVATTGLGLTFGRSYPQTLSQRFEQGILGRGWTHDMDIH